jgi:hypothetical protein
MFILVMAALALVLVGTFVLRPSLSDGGGRALYYAIRIGIVCVALLYGQRHPPHHRAAAAAADAADTTDPFADPGPAGSTVTSAGGNQSGTGSGPKVMEFNWSTTQPANKPSRP